MLDPKNPDYNNLPFSNQRSIYNYKLMDLTSKPFVSIVTPFYNTDVIFNQTAISVMNQSFQQWEWIIVNDGSDDEKSLSLLNYYKNLDKRIRVIDHVRNKGLSAARNTGYKNARANYVVQIDSDDLLEPTSIEKWVWFLESFPEYSFVKGFTVGFGANEYLWSEGFHCGDEFLIRNLVNPTFAIRKNVFEITGGYNEDDYSGLMDWDFWLKCASLGFWGDTVPEYLDWYRRRTDHSDRWPAYDEGAKQHAYWLNLKNKYKKLWDEGFPDISAVLDRPTLDYPDTLPFENLLGKTKKRLLLIIPWMKFGGADKFNLSLLNQLVQKGWEISIIATLHEDHSWMNFYSKFTSDIFVLPNFLKLNDYPRFIKYFINSRNIDIIMISQSELGYALLPYIRFNFRNINIIDYCHIEELEWENGGYPRISIDNSKYLDMTLVTSHHLKNWISNNVDSVKRTEVCYINIDTKEYKKKIDIAERIKESLGIPQTKTIILFSGRLCEQKQPMVLVKTIEELISKKLDFVCLIAGDGPDKTKILEYISNNKLDQYIRYLGELDINTMKDYYSIADIFFLPSKWEGISLSIFEAMANSLPIVSANVGGQSELVTPSCGFLVNNSNQNNEIAEYSNILERLIVNCKLRKELGSNSRERVVKHFNIDKMGDLFEGYLGEIMLEDDSKRNNDILYSETMIRKQVYKALYYEYTKRNWKKRIEESNTYCNEDIKKKIFLFLQSRYEPFYKWANRRNWKWHNKLSEFVKYIIFKI